MKQLITHLCIWLAFLAPGLVWAQATTSGNAYVPGVPSSNGYGTSGQCFTSNGPFPSIPSFQACTGSGSATLASTQVGFGSSGNALSGISGFTYNTTTGVLTMSNGSAPAITVGGNTVVTATGTPTAGQIATFSTGSVVSGANALPYGTQVGIAAGTVFDITAYGAKCDGSTDDTSSINAAFTAALTAYTTGSLSSAKILFPVQHNCKITGSINGTGFNNFGKLLVIDGQGSTLYLNGSAAVPVMDLLGSVKVRISNLSIYASAGSQTYGVQWGRINVTASDSGGNGIVFDHVIVEGSYTQAACYNFSGENVLLQDLSCENTNVTTGYGLVQDGANHFNITSAFVTESAPVDTYQSFNSNTIIGGQYQAVAPGYTPVWMEATTGHRLINVYTYVASTTGSCYTLFSTAAAAPYGNNKGLDLEGTHCEGNGGPSYFFNLNGPGSGTNFTATPLFVSLHMSEPYLSATTQIFNKVSAANLTTPVFEDLKINIEGGPASSSAVVFGSSGSSYTVNGAEVHIYKASIWDGAASTPAFINKAGTQTLDGTAIGARAAAAGTFTTVNSTSSVYQLNGTTAISVPATNTIAVGPSSTATGASNTLLGAGSGNGSMNGIQNVCVGQITCTAMTSSGNNVIIGRASGATAPTGGSGGDILIGEGLNALTTSTANEINIGGLLFYNNVSTAAPAVSACGSSPSIDSRANNKSGTITAGSGTVTSCTSTFAGGGYVTWNHCRVTSRSNISGFAYSISLTAIIITGASVTSDVFDYDCDGY